MLAADAREETAVTLEAQAQKLVAGLVRVAVMAPTDAPRTIRHRCHRRTGR
ncbi:hypothetical protein GCM10027610_142760 [Dactylosporangium cerinum]